MQEVRKLDNQEIQANEAIGKKLFVKHLYEIIKDLKYLENPILGLSGLVTRHLLQVGRKFRIATGGST
jgi:hypothetical protein